MSPIPSPAPVGRVEHLQKEIKDTLALLHAKRSQQDDLGAALTEAHMNELLEALKEASDA